MPSITFTAPTLRELSQQIVEFVGAEIAPAAPAAPPAAPSVGRPVPAWAPAGSRWVAMPGAPMLVTADGNSVPIKWEGSTPTPGLVMYNHNPEAEASGAALLAVLGGS